MTPEQTKALELARYYVSFAKKSYPDYHHTRMHTKNPLKSPIFRYCYKLITETQGKLKEEDYEYYIRAQFEIVRNYKSSDGTHPPLNYNMLVGDKAWNRWLQWQRLHRRARENPVVREKQSTETQDISEYLKTANKHTQDLVRDLKKTKQFFFVRFDRLHNDDMICSLKNGNMLEWIALNKVSPYYYLLSPLVKKHSVETDLLIYGIDISIHAAHLNDGSEHFFRQIFPHEFLD